MSSVQISLVFTDTFQLLADVTAHSRERDGEAAGKSRYLYLIVVMCCPDALQKACQANILVNKTVQVIIQIHVVFITLSCLCYFFTMPHIIYHREAMCNLSPSLIFQFWDIESQRKVLSRVITEVFRFECP